MQDLLKRHFWIVGALSVLGCSFFVAKAIGHVIEEQALVDAKVGPKVAAAAPVASQVSEARSKDGKPLVDRNMFCATCVQEVPVVATAPTDPSFIPGTSLPLVLVATNIGGKPSHSFATVFNTQTLRQGAYSIGDVIPDAGKVKSITGRHLDFENQASSNRVERVLLDGVVPVAAPPPTAVAAAPVPAGEEGDLSSAIDAGIKKIDDTNFEISRALVDQVLANPMAVAKGARVVPAVKNNKPDGFKLYAIRPSSVYAKLGLSNGDTLRAVNGMDLSSADKALEVYTKVRESSSLQVEVTRRGKPVTLNYTIK